jgi:hypothetical protein
MTKYTRSIQKLTVTIEDILNTSGISIDTKAIALVLAATMSASKLNSFLEPITALGNIKSQLLEINALRNKFGTVFRDYIILHAMQTTKMDISSDELQQFISDIARIDSDIAPKAIEPALEAEIAALEPQLQPQLEDVQQASKFLLQKLALNSNDYSAAILDTYLDCRARAAPRIAYYTLIYAIAEVLTQSGLESKQALVHSHKLATHALQLFMQSSPDSNAILHSYKSTYTSYS